MSLPPYILVENSVHNSADRVINWASLHEILVVSCAVGNVEIVTSASIPFGIDSVQCKRNNRVNICGEGRFRPGGIDFATRHIFYIFRKRYLNVRRIRTGRPQMYRNRVWDYDLAQNAWFHIGSFLFTGIPHGNGRFPDGNLSCNGLPLCLSHGGKYDWQDGSLPVKNRNIRNEQGIEAKALRKHGVACKRQPIIVWSL